MIYENTKNQSNMKNLKVLFTVLCVACATAVWSEEVTITFASGTNSNATYYFQNTSGSITNVLSFSTAKNSSSTDPAYNSNNSELRLYYHSGGAGGSITITTKDGVTITGFVLTTSTTPSTKYIAGDGSATDISYTNKVATVNNLSCSSLKIQNCNKSNTQLRIKSIKVIYSSGSTETTPSITLQPVSATCNQGVTATALTITADGNPAPTYQWYSNTSNNNSNGTEISGATKASYTPSTATTGTFYYYCVATNSQGSASSNVATITVNTVTTYTVQWMVGGAEYIAGNPTTSVKSGERVTTLPTAPADNSLSCAEKFMGWSAQNIGATPQIDAPADLFTTADASPAITENTTFYAVFAKPQQNNK